MTFHSEVAIVGAGPYGLSIAAHLRAHGVSHRIYGSPMQTWRERMPDGMLLKSDGFASNLSEPSADFTLKHFCEAGGVPYDDTRVPVEIGTFISYGMAFQKKFVPELDQREVAGIGWDTDHFALVLDDGEQVRARRVVLAVGISHFAYVPPNIGSLPPEFVSHSSAHLKDISQFRGRDVTVIGGGASAIDLAALLHEEGAKPCILARRSVIDFHEPPKPGPRSRWERLRRPSSGLGPGWPSRFFTGAPSLFRYFPERQRLRIVRQHLGPAPGWPMRDRVLGKVPMVLGTKDLSASVQGCKVRLTFTQHGAARTHLTEHVIAATGYRVDTRRLGFLSENIQAKLKTLVGSPTLSSHFESSVPGLYFVGIASANTFGPMMRFAFGADYTAHRISRHLAATASLPATQIIRSHQMA